MVRSVFAFFAFMIFSNWAVSQYSLEIEITGLRSDTGVIMLRLLDENEGIVNQDKGIIKDKKSLIIFTGLKPGNYAVQYYHDENLSEEMETNSIGIPKEGYGFSNDAYGIFGPKPFKERMFDLKENKRILLKIKYH